MRQAFSSVLLPAPADDVKSFPAFPPDLLLAMRRFFCFRILSAMPVAAVFSPPDNPMSFSTSIRRAKNLFSPCERSFVHLTSAPVGL
jgi:hypothetical protein